MSLKVEKEKARKMRAQGKSYSEIKEVLKVSKSSLSLWLQDMPLSDKQMRALRDFNPRRIESYRRTMELKRQTRLSIAYEKAKKDIGNLTKRELFLAGLFLYWGEGTKASRGRVSFSNTNPAMIKFFLKWLISVGIDPLKLKVRLHLYTDMDVKKETIFWSKELGLSIIQFSPAYIKSSTLSGLTYKNGYGHGTCNLNFDNVPFWEYVMMSLKRIMEVSGDIHP